MMAQKDLAAQKYKPIQLVVPGITWGPLQIDAFLGGGKLYDTPGGYLHHRRVTVVHSEDSRNKDYLNLFFRDIYRPIASIHNLVMVMLWRLP
ncbi:hypothetical protein V6N13_058433 [Hibiscus sabdariffa]